MASDNTTAGPASTPKPPSTAWEERRRPGEEELFEEFAHYIKERQGRLLKERPEIARQTGGQLLRGFHAKPHASLNAEFEVLPDLPAHARFGVFSEPRTFPALVRFSNGTHTLQPDYRTEPRGIAVKLVGVGGRKLLEGQEDAVTQDFLATSHSVTQTVRDVKQFRDFVVAEEKGRLLLPFRLAWAVGPGEAWRILSALRSRVLKPPVRSMATEVYEGTAPIKLGPYAVKYTFRPAEGTEPAGGEIPTDNGEFLKEDLAGRLSKGDIVFDFLVQFFVDELLTPIEDTSVRWEPSVAPFLKVARLRIPRCELDEGLGEKVNRLSFTPWHATEDHRPLGNVMRARKVAYELSADNRKHSPEPTRLPLP